MRDDLGLCAKVSWGLPRFHRPRHDSFMHMPWNKSKPEQLDLSLWLTADSRATPLNVEPDAGQFEPVEEQHARPADSAAQRAVQGLPLMLSIERLYEDTDNPRTEFPEAELDEIAESIRHYGILQAVVVHPPDAEGRYRIHFGAKRWRAARRVGMLEVPVVVRDAPADAYTQVAENRKRHDLTPLDLARFIRSRVDAGDSNATVAKRLGMNMTTVAHHLTLLELPPELDEALKSGRCTSPRTLNELSRLHHEKPEQVRALVAGDAEITRAVVSSLRASPEKIGPRPLVTSSPNKLVLQANAACDRLERVLVSIRLSDADLVALPELIALRIRVEDITKHWLQGSDCQTPSLAGR